MINVNIEKTNTVIDEYGQHQTVSWDETTTTIMDYDNVKGYVEYNVAIRDDNPEFDKRFYADVLVRGKVDNIEDRLKTWNNEPKVATAIFCSNFKITTDSPARNCINDAVINLVKDNQQLFFTKSGNWRRNNRNQQANAIYKTCFSSLANFKKKK